MTGPHANVIYTLGHSNHPLVEFIDLLRRHDITAVADVRSQPYSRRHPVYCREPLKTALHDAGIAYVFLGRELGGRSRDPAHYDGEGRIDYPRFAGSPLFGQGLDRLCQGMARYRIALLCAEKEPLDCHRGLLIAPRLQDVGIDVHHILAGGELECHRQTEERLLGLYHLDGGDLIDNRERLLALAYRRRSGGFVAARAQARPGKSGR